jgi:glycerophosphoryl diester phosphodiesterase
MMATIKRLYAMRGPVLFTHIVMSLVTAAVIAPLTGAAIQLAIELSGKPALTDMEIARFFLTPVGLACVLVGGGFLVVLASLELAVLLLLVRSGHPPKKGMVASAFMQAGRALPSLLAVGIQLVARVLAIIAPFAACLAAIAWVFLREHDINYYLAMRPPEFARAVLLAAPLIVVLAAVLLRRASDWIFVLPLVLFARTPPTAVFRESRRLASGKRWRIAGYLAGWAASTIAISALASGLFRIVASTTLTTAETSATFFVAVGAVLLTAWFTMLAVLGAISAGLLAMLVLRLAEHAGLSWAMPVRGEALPAAHPRALWLALGAFVVLSLGSTALAISDATRSRETVEVIAHRGAAGSRPENTLAAVRKAIEDGADWIEVDVQENADGEVVVIHDKDFMRFAGNPLKVWDARSSDMAAIDVGSWFGPEYSAERVPSLRSVLETARGHAKVLVELKYYGHDERLAERVVSLVEETGMEDQTAFMSLEPKQVLRMKALRPDWRVGTLAARSAGDPARLRSDFLAVSSAIATAPYIGHAVASGKDVLVWTIDDPIDMSRMVSRGVSGLITNEPALARVILEERKEMSIMERLMLEAADFFGIEARPGRPRDQNP